MRINLNAPALVARHSTGQPAPASVAAEANIDTGSNVTCVSAAILQQLGLVAASQSKTHGVGGQVQVRLFRVSLMISDAAPPHAPWFTDPDLLVMELPSGTPVDVLIGMDVLLQCRLTVDGPAGTFTLDY